MNLDSTSNQVYIEARDEAKKNNHEYIMPEHFLYASLNSEIGKEIIKNSGGNVNAIVKDLQYFFEYKVSKHKIESPIESFGFVQMLELASNQAYSSSRQDITLGNLLVTIFSLKESNASYIMEKNNVDKFKMLKFISHEIKDDIKGMNSLNDYSDFESEENLDKDKEFLDKYSQNLTLKAKQKTLDPVIGREDIMDRTIQVLSRRLKNNPIHIGHPGVGKTSIIEGLAQKIVNKEVPKNLENAEIYYLDIGSIVAGTKYRGDFEERLLRILEIISKKENSIIYFDEIHTVVGAGSVSSGGMDATSIIKPFLAKGDIKFIGSTTFDEYKKFLEKDRALTRRFQRIDVEEPTVEESIEILKGLKNKYEEYHNVVYSNEIIKIICDLSNKYLNDKHLPDKAIDVMDETGAYININNKSNSKVKIKSSDIEKTISIMAKIPTETVSSDDLKKLKNLEKNLKLKVFGQDEAIKKVVNSIKLSRAGLKEEFKPIGSMLFVGPTGVGKTEIARQISKELNIKLLRYDMSEYQEKHSVSKLVGSPPGYVGFEEGGLLTEEIRRTPHSVLLLDEIEKAHPDILNVLLQVMDYGILTDNSGNKADFSNVIIIMTSNAGAREIGKKLIGFEEKILDFSEIDKEVEKIFSPEFRNRLDNIIVFNHIDEKMASKIVRKSFDELEETLKNKNLKLKHTKKLSDYIVKIGLSDKYGAREIKRIINSDVKKLLVEVLLFGNYKNQSTGILDYENNEITLKIEK